MNKEVIFNKRNLNFSLVILAIGILLLSVNAYNSGYNDPSVMGHSEEEIEISGSGTDTKCNEIGNCAQVCIADECRVEWPGSGSSSGSGTGDITAVIAGTGLSGGGTTGAVTLNIANPSKSCPSGKVIQSFDLSSSASPVCVDTGSSGSSSGGVWSESGNNIYYNNGKVGIGTASPEYDLHVKNTGDGKIIAEGGSGNKIGLLAESGKGYISSSKSLELVAWGGNIILGNLGSSKVGIGTASPTYKLDVSGSIRAKGGSVGGEAFYDLSSNGDLTGYKVDPSGTSNLNQVKANDFCTNSGTCLSSVSGSSSSGGGSLSCTKATGTKSGNWCTANCPSGYTLTGGGADADDGTGCTLNANYPSGNSWRAAVFPVCNGGVNCWAICCKIA